MKEFSISLLKVAGVTFLRFRPVPRVWCVWLVAVNLACVFFIQHAEAKVVLAVSLVAVLLQAAIHQRVGFVRLLGVAHVLWIPMLAWLGARFDALTDDPGLQAWIIALLMTNVISLIVDGIDVSRYLNGERQPHYTWK